jgi:membrane-associated protease RseP (regulator of RpoE activity)
MTNMIWHKALSSGAFVLLCTLGFVAPRCGAGEEPGTTNHATTQSGSVTVVVNAEPGSAASGVVASQSSGDEQGGTTEHATTQSRSVTVVVNAEPGSHWLGIHAIPVDEAIRAHLGLDERLIVQHVVPESPAAKAGLQQHDILLKFGDVEIHTLENLMQTVSDNKDKEVAVTLLRGGKEQTVQVTPAKRPEGNLDLTVEAIPQVQHLEGIVRGWMGDRGIHWQPAEKLNLRLFGPGFVGAAGPFPKELSVSITKEGDKPAQVVVKRNEDKWEVTEESLDKLPDDVRPHVERVLGRGGVLLYRTPGELPVPAISPPDVRAIQPRVLQERIELRRDAAEKKAVEELKKAQEEYQKALEELRQEVKELRDRASAPKPEGV